MRIFSQNEPLAEAELDRLKGFLKRPNRSGMNVEELDGFFASLIAGPELVMPSEYLPLVLGGGNSDSSEFGSLEEASEILALMMRHWNNIAATLARNEVYVPVLLTGAEGRARGNDWARGFMRGVTLRRDAWAVLLADEEHAGCLVPMLVLYHEHDEDPKMRLGPVSPRRRKRVIQHMADGLLCAYRYFRRRLQPSASTSASKAERASHRIGRNDPCPCGSGKKYKHCCGPAVH